MQHYQSRIACGVCKRPFIVDIFSVGTPHQFVKAVTCEECAKRAGGLIMAPGEVAEVSMTRVERPLK